MSTPQVIWSPASPIRVLALVMLLTVGRVGESAGEAAKGTLDAGAWRFLERACRSLPDGGAACLQLWHPPEVTDPPEQDRVPLHFEIDFPDDGDVVVCQTIDFICPLDFVMCTSQLSAVRGGELPKADSGSSRLCVLQ